MIELAPLALGIIATTTFAIYAAREVSRLLIERRDERLKQHLSWNGRAPRVSRVAVTSRRS
jgi:hypothetical protein